MNKKQLTAMWAGILALLAAFLYPPLLTQGNVSDLSSDSLSSHPSWPYDEPAGFHFLLSRYDGRVDGARLTAEMLLICAITGGAIATLKNKP